MTVKTIQHFNPVWREDANFIIGIEINISSGDDPSWEQLWSRKISENRFMICCIPFFPYNLSLGDEVFVVDPLNWTFLKGLKGSADNPV